MPMWSAGNISRSGAYSLTGKLADIRSAEQLCEAPHIRRRRPTCEATSTSAECARYRAVRLHPLGLRVMALRCDKKPRADSQALVLRRPRRIERNMPHV